MKAGRIRRIPVRSIKAHLWKAPSATVESRVSRLVSDPLRPRDDQTPTTSRANVSLLIQEQGSQYAFNLWGRTSPWRLMTCSFQLLCSGPAVLSNVFYLTNLGLGVVLRRSF